MNNMHKTGCRGAHGPLQVMGLERVDSRRVAHLMVFVGSPRIHR